jgi:hypothetical protein
LPQPEPFFVFRNKELPGFCLVTLVEEELNLREEIRAKVMASKKPVVQKAGYDESGVCKAFYLQPNAYRRRSEDRKKDDSEVSYKNDFMNSRMGENKIGDMLKVITRQVGLDGDGERTNHALRRTAIMMAKQAGLSEQEIVRRSRHHDVDSLRNYLG